MRKALTTLALGWFSRLRFPTLLVITGILFAVSVAVPDFVPFIDEILLGLLTLLLARWKKRDPDTVAGAGQAERRAPIDVTPTRGGRGRRADD
jgi:hypothetical protein